MDETAKILKALGDATRLRILHLLTHGELCVCDLTAALALPQSTISRHLSYLKNAGWLHSKRVGVWMHYELVDEAMQQEVLSALVSTLSAGAQQDMQRLKDYLSTKKHAC